MTKSRAAFDAMVSAVRDLMTARGHTIGQLIREDDDPWTLSVQCSVCEHWATISIPPQNTAEQDISGQALGSCRGTPWRKPQAQPERVNDAGYRYVGANA